MATLYYAGEMASLAALETTCNTEEFSMEEKLTSLDRVSNDGKKATEAVYVASDTDKLGQLRIEKFDPAKEDEALFKGKVFILTQPVDVLVFR